ncbi:hypothetical protein LVJ83_09685 [Uruburuella testudinis]|uniref:Uncharacterized protein n=1 Tax=Uruburuella testudinis TaxID=1282863 RepID=A0ABY4DQS1_9NEIS|nr:hypothetical protein [Uruburuella testudinis]UOO81236.1 hypothetical protein LVJ83_09685 [Uruburuella testudinis]
MNEAMGTNLPTNDYFPDSAFYDRAAQYIYFSQNVSMEEANEHMGSLYEMLSPIPYEKYVIVNSKKPHQIGDSDIICWICCDGRTALFGLCGQMKAANKQAV